MTYLLKIDFTFDFPNGEQSHQVDINLGERSSSDKYIQGLQDIITRKEDLDFQDEDSVMALEWLLEHQLQYEIIYPNLEISNIVLDEQKDKITFNLDLNLWGEKFSTVDELTGAEGFNIDKMSTESELKEIIIDNYYGTHHNFDILDIALTPTL